MLLIALSGYKMIGNEKQEAFNNESIRKTYKIRKGSYNKR